MPEPALHLFGPPQVVFPRGGAARGLGSSKNLALLAYLALEPGPHARDELATLLWGDSREEAARASLRQSLKRLRDALGEAIRIDRRTVELAGPIECDVNGFLHALGRDPAAAATFDVRRFLTGFSVRGAPDFEEWASAKRQSLLRRFEGAVSEAARRAMDESRWRDAALWGDLWLSCDPLSEDAALTLVEATYLAGDRASAAFGDHLGREMAVTPGAALIRLVRRIEADPGGAPARSARRTPVPNGFPSFECSLVGREKPWRALVKVWQRTGSGAGHVVLIEGERGVGKTRMAEEFLRFASLEGATTLSGRGYDPQLGIPFGPVVEILGSAIDAPGAAATDAEWLTEVARLVPEVRRRFPGVEEPSAPARAAERWRLFEGVARLLLAVAEEHPTAVLVDDLSWCDGESCALLHFLVRRLAPAPLTFLATVSLGEAERDAPADRLLRALRAREQTLALTLPPFTEEQVWELIRTLGRIDAPQGARRFARRVHAVTDGNPFHVLELLKTLFAQGVLAVDGTTGKWVSTGSARAGPLQLPMPETVHVAIAERIARMPYQLRDLLAVVAVAGSGCRAALLSQILGISRLHAASLADELVERRLLTDDEGLYRCAHPVIGDVVRNGLTVSRRRELHRALALTLIDLAPEDDGRAMAGEVARHASRGGERTVAYRYALCASEAAVARFAFEDAFGWLDVAARSAAADAETEEVNRRTADVLHLAGWSDVPHVPRRTGTPARGIDQADLDLQAV